LTDREEETLELIRAAQRNLAIITVREVAEALGYESVSSPHRFMTELERKGRIRQVKRGVYEVVEVSS